MEIFFTGPSGTPHLATIQRVADGAYREDDSETFVSSPAFVDKDITLDEGTNENRGSYTRTVDASTWNNGIYRLRVHQSGSSPGTVAGTLFAIYKGEEIPVGEHIPMYYAQIKYIKDRNNSQDEFAVVWFKNDFPLNSGDITNPRISAYNTSTGATVFTNQSMNYASVNLGVTRYNVGTVLPSGEPWLISVSGTIDSVVRTWSNVVGLDLF